MKQTQIHTLTMLEDALATATHYPPASPPADFPVLLSELTDAITQAKAAAVTQAVDRGSSSTALRMAREALFIDYLIPIRSIAIGRLAAVPNVRQLFRLPKKTTHRTTLIKVATIIATNAALYKETFIASGLPADFLDRLHGAITNVEQAIETHVTTRGDQQKATRMLAITLRQGRQLVYGLNGIIQTAFARNPEVLAAWNSAQHIRRPATSTGPEPSASTSTTPMSMSTTMTGATPSLPSVAARVLPEGSPW